MLNLKNLLDKSKVSNAEIAAILHVGRMSTWRWQHGIEPRQELTRITCDRILSLLATAIDKNLLPLQDDVKKSERISVIKRILKSLA